MHVGGHLRAAFGDWVESGCCDALAGEDSFYEGARPTRWLFEQLWFCTDVMPLDLCDILDMPQGSSYGDAVRLLIVSLPA